VTDETLLSIPEVARELGVTTTIVYRLIESDAIRPARTERRGRQTRRFFRATDVATLKRQREGEAEDV
jgi:excisionase family DNA binding protein